MTEYRRCPHCHMQQRHFGTGWVHSATRGRKAREVAATCRLIREKREEARAAKTL